MVIVLNPQSRVIMVACEVVKDLLNVGELLGLPLDGLVLAKVCDTKSVGATLFLLKGDWSTPRIVISSNDPRVQLHLHLFLDEGQLGLAKTLQH